MTLALDDAFLPATLAGHPMSDDEFAAFCAEHPDLSFEMSAEGEIIVMPPTYSKTGVRNSYINLELGIWARADARGFTCDSSSGFVLPNGARRSPDAAWVLTSRVDALDRESQEKYWHLAPDFVIELKSSTDRLKVVRSKMHEWMANGTELGWLIDPYTRSVIIYRADGTEETVESINSLAGESPVAGFVLDLTRVWDPIRA